MIPEPIGWMFVGALIVLFFVVVEEAVNDAPVEAQRCAGCEHASSLHQKPNRESMPPMCLAYGCLCQRLPVEEAQRCKCGHVETVHEHVARKNPPVVSPWNEYDICHECPQNRDDHDRFHAFSPVEVEDEGARSLRDLRLAMRLSMWPTGAIGDDALDALLRDFEAAIREEATAAPSWWESHLEMVRRQRDDADRNVHALLSEAAHDAARAEAAEQELAGWHEGHDMHCPAIERAEDAEGALREAQDDREDAEDSRQEAARELLQSFQDGSAFTNGSVTLGGAAVEVEDEGARPQLKVRRDGRRWLYGDAQSVFVPNEVEAAIRKESTAASNTAWEHNLTTTWKDLALDNARLRDEWRTRAEAAERALRPFAKLDERPHTYDELLQLVYAARRALTAEHDVRAAGLNTSTIRREIEQVREREARQHDAQ